MYSGMSIWNCKKRLQFIDDSDFKDIEKVLEEFLYYFDCRKIP
jgi:hypothetical protein